MHLATPSRRALGLAAVSAIAMSTAVLSVGGVAQAAPAPIPFTAADGSITVQAGYCSIDWHLVGGSGGADGNAVAGAFGGELVVTTEVEEDDEFVLWAGTAGADGTPGNSAVGGVNGSGSWNGISGMNGGGGGGAASTVEDLNGTMLVAFGGDGAGSDAVYGQGAGDEENGAPGITEPSLSRAATAGGNGTVTGTIQPCAPVAPGTPTVNWIEAGNGSAQLQIWRGSIPQDSTGTPVYEYSLDGGAWQPLVTGGDYQYEPTIPGLTNGQTYSVRVQMTVDGVTSAPTVAKTVTPFAPIGAPGGVTVSTSPTAVTVSWTAPTTAGTFPLAGYSIGMGAGEMGGEACTTGADVLSCVITGVASGADYSVVVFAVDDHENFGEASQRVMTGAIPFPASVPTSNGPLATQGFSTGSVTPGQTITVSGTGYAPFSTVTVLVYSTPTVLGTAVADENGAFTFTGKLPAGLAAGSHTLVAAGVDANGDPRYLTMAVTVAGSTTGSGGLAYTGADVAVPAIGGLAALAIGGGLVVAGRRRRTAE